MSSQPYTRSYFNEEYVSFREIMGDLRNWDVDNEDGSSPIERAFKGLATVWLNTVVSKRRKDTSNNDVKEIDAAWHVLTLEYARRGSMMAMAGA